jgi:hypothetical protein
MATILNRGADRGEVDPARLTPQLTTLPADLMRHALILRHHVPDEAEMTEIVDDIFLPLVRPR